MPLENDPTFLRFDPGSVRLNLGYQRLPVVEINSYRFEKKECRVFEMRGRHCFLCECSLYVVIGCLAVTSQFFFRFDLFGVYVDFGECLAPPIHVLTIYVIGGNVVENCCWWPFTDIQIVDCNDEVIGVGSSGGMLSIEPCELTAPHSPFPADDAVGFPATVLFNWLTENPPVECYGTPLVYNFYIGTDSESLVQHWWVGPPYEVNGLLPGTRYYWQADVEILGTEGPYISPLWSFVTEGAVPVEQSTWGRIKSLFK